MEVKFSSPKQEEAFGLQKRNQCICGGYGSGKTFVVCLKLILLAIEFPGYRTAIIRRERKVLFQTTYQTFIGIIGENYKKLIETDDKTNGVTTFKNGSQFLWLGLDRFSINDLKSLELNACFMDQGEEMDEAVYVHADARIDRWAKVTVPEKYWKNNPEWRMNPFTGNPMAPSYNIVVCNPDLETHWIWREFHPDSVKAQSQMDTHEYIVIPSCDNAALSPENLKAMMKKDPTWVRRFVFGEWGNNEAQIHNVTEDNILEPSREWLDNFLSKALLYRTYDHGEASPSCCLWMAAYRGIYVFYREYYQPNKLISYHRQVLQQLSGTEQYAGNFADPEIFKKKHQNQGGRYSCADEYKDTRLCPYVPVYWRPADNNEMGTRNRINELLQPDDEVRHPITGLKGAPRLYFVKRNEEHPQGCYNAIIQTKSQRRVKLSEENGRIVYSDERDDSVEDHAYDPVRYGIAIHAHADVKELQKVSPNSFMSHFNRYARPDAYSKRMYF